MYCSVRMIAKTELSAPKRRTRAEVQQLVAEFVSSGMRRSEFCESRGFSFSTLDRHLKKRRWKRMCRPVSSAGRLVPVELAKKSLTHHESSYGLAVVLPGGVGSRESAGGSPAGRLCGDGRHKEVPQLEALPNPIACTQSCAEGHGATYRLVPRRLLANSRQSHPKPPRPRSLWATMIWAGLAVAQKMEQTSGILRITCKTLMG
jgi:hypothetical protein